MNRLSGLMLFAAVTLSTMLASGCSKPPERPTAAIADNVSDVDVTTNVKTALQQNDTLKGFDITVVTLKGDVRLIGTLNTQEQIDQAIKIARSSAGTHTIHDELTIKKP